MRLFRRRNRHIFTGRRYGHKRKGFGYYFFEFIEDLFD